MPHFRDYRGTEGVIEDIDPTPVEEVERRRVAVRRSNSVNTAQALRSERTPEADEGVKAFGPPLNTGVSDTARQTKNQTTDEGQ